MLSAALEPRALTAARIVAEHVRMRSEARDDLLDRAMYLAVIGDIGHEATNICRNSRRRRRKLAIDHRNFVDYFFLE
jgi:hypothetical protein